jgi:hypothetical protein
VPEPTPQERAADLRRDAFEKCDAGQWQECLDGLDRAQGLDPAGDSNPAVQEKRDEAQRALHPVLQEKSPAPTPPKWTAPVPTSSFGPDSKGPTKPRAPAPNKKAGPLQPGTDSSLK